MALPRLRQKNRSGGRIRERKKLPELRVFMARWWLSIKNGRKLTILALSNNWYDFMSC
jgi:hypothetical protein